MGSRCGCVGKECNCAIVSTDTAFIESGAGTEANPYVIGRNSRAFFQRQPGEGTEIAVTGSGTPTAPYVITANLTSSNRSPAVTAFYASGGDYQYWQKPTGVTLVKVVVIGGGGGGASGSQSIAGDGYAGGGGDGGGYSSRYFYLPSYIGGAEVRVGPGGAGGTASRTGPGDYGWTYPRNGEATFVTFYDNGGNPQDSIFAAGGRGGALVADSNYRPSTTVESDSTGMHFGQIARIPGTGALLTVIGLGAGAGGQGEGQGAGGSALNGGHHLGSGLQGTFYDDTIANPERAGGGGNGGAQSTGQGWPGSAGWPYGGGGGGGGATTSPASFAGGAGGKGADGVAVITSF